MRVRARCSPSRCGSAPSRSAHSIFTAPLPATSAATDLTGALHAADAGALALLRLDSNRDDTFDEDLDTRATYQLQVHQATGMVQVQLGVTTEEAFLMLRARAFASGRSLADVATDVVARRLRFTSEDK